MVAWLLVYDLIVTGFVYCLFCLLFGLLKLWRFFCLALGDLFVFVLWCWFFVLLLCMPVECFVLI